MSESDKPAQTAASKANVDSALFTCVNEYLEVANRQANRHGPKRVSFATLYAASRYNVHAFLLGSRAMPANADTFVDYMTDLYRRSLLENLHNVAGELGLGDAAPIGPGDRGASVDAVPDAAAITADCVDADPVDASSTGPASIDPARPG